MTEDFDYEELGFKCGLELHQQLNTKTKLFCDCPVKENTDSPDIKVERRLHAVRGEEGDTDEAAETEEEKDRTFEYKFYNENNCLVELDEEPPHKLDQEALETTLKFCEYVDANVPEEIQIMRKIVVDGSNTTGFQRTAMVGFDGSIETSEGSVEIQDIEIEEESAGIHKREGNKAIYDLDRLGIPLIEVGTDASLKNPGHAKEVALKLGMLLRSTRNVRRGLGTVRQDVNVSIREGSRVEIKGFQNIKEIDDLIRKEVERQHNLVELGSQLEYEDPNSKEVSGVLESSGNEMVETLLDEGSAIAVKLPNLGGKLKQNISGNRYLALELVDQVKNFGLDGMIHSDEDLGNYGLEDEFKEFRKELDADPEDAIGLVLGPSEKVSTAVEAVVERTRKILEGEVPEETRTAENDNTTSYARPLPGEARMYPETDVKPIHMDEELRNKIKSHLKPTLEKREEELSEQIGSELASQLVSSERFPEFESIEDEVPKKTAATTFTNILPKLDSKGYNTSKISVDLLEKVLKSVKTGEVNSGEVEDVIKFILEENQTQDPVQSYLESKSSQEEIREVVKDVVESNESMIDEQGQRAQGALMGQIMQKVDASGSEVSDILGEELQKKL